MARQETLVRLAELFLWPQEVLRGTSVSALKHSDFLLETMDLLEVASELHSCFFV